jgi:hypothetical protein
MGHLHQPAAAEPAPALPHVATSTPAGTTGAGRHAGVATLAHRTLVALLAHWTLVALVAVTCLACAALATDLPVELDSCDHELYNQRWSVPVPSGGSEALDVNITITLDDKVYCLGRGPDNVTVWANGTDPDSNHCPMGASWTMLNLSQSWDSVELNASGSTSSCLGAYVTTQPGPPHVQMVTGTAAQARRDLQCTSGWSLPRLCAACAGTYTQDCWDAWGAWPCAGWYFSISPTLDVVLGGVRSSKFELRTPSSCQVQGRDSAVGVGGTVGYVCVCVRGRGGGGSGAWV